MNIISLNIFRMYNNFWFARYTILNGFLPKLTLVHFSHNKFLVWNNNNTNSNFLKRQRTTLMSDNNNATIDIAGTSVPVTALQTNINVASILEFKPFKDWVSAISKESYSVEKKEVEFRKIEIQNVDYFGPKIGFIKFKVDARLIENGKNVPGIVFMRGGSVAVLLILRSKDEDEIVNEHVVLTEQPRIPVPSLAFPEIPAGMLDGSGNFTGKASEEIKEETGIVIKDQDLIDMTELAYGNQYKGVYPSPGGSDEFMRLCLCIKDMSVNDVLQLEGKLGGLRNHGESIVVRLIKLNELWKIPDMKALSALCLYKALKKEKKV